MEPLVIIAGPTAVGKSDMAVALAKRIGGEIISADSMQVYKGMDIGSAKISQKEMQGIKHHLIDVLEPTEDFNVFLFKELAQKAIEKIRSNGHIPILVGGTGFYIQALLYDIDFSESEGELSDYRKMLDDRAKNESPEILFNELLAVDPDYCKIIHMNDTKRVIRALEFFHDTGKPISAHNREQHSNAPVYNACFFVLNSERKTLYDRIDFRVDKMIECGLVDEVKRLKNLGLTVNDVSMHGLGYKEILMYLDGVISLDEAVYRIKRDSRHFAKRQITWFKREKEVIWINREDFNEDNDLILEEMISRLKAKNIYEDN